MTNILSLLIALATTRAVCADSHYTYANYQVNYIKKTCDVNTCVTTPATQTLQTRSCVSGWDGCKCDTPICTNPVCDGDKVCIQPNQCGCLRTGTTNCLFVQCQNTNRDCYPGTCSSDLSNCTCPPWFSGPNCLDITKAPNIQTCSVEIYDPSSVRTNFTDCAATGYNSTSVTWIKLSSVGKIDVKWRPVYDNSLVLPGSSYVNYIETAPPTIGITNCSVDLVFLDLNSTFPPKNYPYPTTTQSGIPSSFADCSISIPWGTEGLPTPQHGMSFRVTAKGQLGAQKHVIKDYNGNIATGRPIQTFIGAESTRSSVFKFDLKPPVHCLTLNPQNNPPKCPYFAIYLDQDIRTNPKIEPKFYNWTDDGSGIASFLVQIYQMQPDTNGQLVQNGNPIGTKSIDPIQNNYLYNFPTGDSYAGVYSIVLTVYDAAGNTARARKLFIYNPTSLIKIIPNYPVYLKEANPSTNYTWLTSFDDPRDGSNIPLTVDWTGHFSSNAGFSTSWSAGAVAWDPSYGIDDRYGTTYGRRSIDRIPQQNGIESYAIAYTVDRNGGGKGLSPSNWLVLNATITTYQLPINYSLADGTTIVIWVQCTDASFGTATEKLTIYVDRTPPQITQEKFNTKTGAYQTNSSFQITVVDMNAGISLITYRIFATGIPLSVVSIPPQTRFPPTNRTKRDLIQACTSNDPTCYCIPKGNCFNYNQTIDINNCDIDRFAGQNFEIRYTVTNEGNLTSIEQSYTLGFLSSGDIPCRPVPTLSGGAIAGIVIGVILGFLLLLLLIFILIMLLRIYYFKKPVPRRIDQMHQTIRNKFAKSYQEESAAYESAGAFSGITKKISVKFKKEENKPKKIDDDEYIYTASDALRNNTVGVVQRKNLQMDSNSTISNEGRFAVIKKAYLQKGNESIVVAVKALRSGYSSADARLMEDKIQFLSNLPPQANIVNFLGASEEDNNGGPIMILEYCGMTLKDWLKSVTKVTSDVLENMTTFTLNIARGVEHLHANKIIHRRLAARNVLLTQQFGGWVAKLIGFGPIRDDNEGDAKKASVPVKWLAPETLTTINSIDPTYNEKTDAWSFGITAWEIYSLGETPYPNKSSSEAKKLIIKGLKPTKPDECPPELYQSPLQPCWDTNPKNRPSFTKICSAIENFRGTNQGGAGGYYTAGDDNEDEGGEELYDDGR